MIKQSDTNYILLIVLALAVCYFFAGCSNPVDCGCDTVDNTEQLPLVVVTAKNHTDQQVTITTMDSIYVATFWKSDIKLYANQFDTLICTYKANVNYMVRRYIIGSNDTTIVVK